VVNGTFRMQQRHMEGHGLGWDSGEAQAGAQKMYEKIFRMKFLPPGRGLWAMGTPITEERGLYAALNNCAFVSTGIPPGGDPTEPFTFLMDAAMLGVGVGFDTKGVGIAVPGPPRGGLPQHHLVGDSREGWVHSLRLQLSAYFKGTPAQAFDYSAVRPRGTPIKGFGGSAAGGEVLATLHASIDSILAPLVGGALSVTAVCDIMNLIGRAVVSGDVRQTAEIAFGDPHCPEYTALKDYRVNPARAAWGWTSNNSVYATLGQGYDALASRVAHNGEPGFAWLENMRAYGRMREDERNWRDARAQGGNPCLEQTLESYELCCLVETFPAAHGGDFEDFADTLRTAFHYAKVVTLGATHWTASNRIMARNRRIGTSLSGIAQFIAAAPAAAAAAPPPTAQGGREGGKQSSRGGVGELVSWCEKGYDVVQAADKALSDTLAIPRSIKTTCIKPSGTVSLLAGATPGMHFPESRFYTRRIRLSKDHGVVGALKEAGYVVEAANEDPTRKVVVEVPVDVGECVCCLVFAGAQCGGKLHTGLPHAHTALVQLSPCRPLSLSYPPTLPPPSPIFQVRACALWMR
jgi:ribonucleoside-triphosphate reductase